MSVPNLPHVPVPQNIHQISSIKAYHEAYKLGFEKGKKEGECELLDFLGVNKYFQYHDDRIKKFGGIWSLVEIERKTGTDNPMTPFYVYKALEDQKFHRPPFDTEPSVATKMFAEMRDDGMYHSES